MKKFILFASVLAGLFAAASCQQEKLEPEMNGGVTYEISLPTAPQTKGENGYSSYDLHYEVYKTADASALETATLLFEKTVQMNGDKTTVTLDLLNDQDYTILFWANKQGEDYFDLTNLRNVVVKTPITANNDNRDAFCGKDQIIQHDGAQTKTVTLTRPFAQVNIATLVPSKTQIGYDVTPSKSYVKISDIPTAFNVFTGLPAGQTTAVEFSTKEDPATIPADSIYVEGKGYKWVAMNYIVVPESVVNVYYEITTANGKVKNTVNNVPVKKNHRTNIIGNLLTSNATYNIQILPGFEDEQTYVYPSYEFSYSDGVYTTSSVKGIQSAIDCIEDGETIRLTNDVNIDATDREDGNAFYYDGDKSFTIDLNGKTISGNTSNVVIRFQKSVHDDNTVTTRSGVVEPLENTITIKNGTIEALENSWSAISIGSSASAKTKVNLEKLTIKSKKANDMAVRARTGAEFTLTNCEVIATNGAGGICAGGGNVTLNDVTVNQTGWYSNNWNSVALGIHSGAKMTVNSGNYTSDPAGDAHGTWVAYIMSSGGVLEINGGTFNGTVGQTASSANACGLICTDAKSEVYINDGVFNSTGAILDIRNNTGATPNPKAVLAGGTFSADPRVSGLYSSNLISVAEGYFVKKNTEGKFIVNNQPVAKVGNVGYGTIDEAVAAWVAQNNATLTLCEDVTLSDVVTLKSTEHHILNLATYTMTAASGKNAIEIVAYGTGDAERYAITIMADANNPGGINAGTKSIVYYDYSKGQTTVNDRPIIKIEGGVFTGSTSSLVGNAGIHTIGAAARMCATINISGGIFNCSINGSGKSKLIITGGLFHYSVGSQGDSTATRLISGGTFKTLGFMTADSNNTKFWFGTSMGNSNVGLYINDDNYLVVGGPVIKEFDESGKFAAMATNATRWSTYLQYSSAATNGLYYTNAEMAIKKHGEANVTLR